MLWNSKSIDTIDGALTCSIREGVKGNGNALYEVVTYLGNGYNRSYKAIRFDTYPDALIYYDFIQ